MAPQPDLHNLVWRAFSFVSRPDPTQGRLQVAPEHLNTIDTRRNIPAVILFPSLLTPNVHVHGENQGRIELLVAAPSSPTLEPEDVNRHLRFSRGLDAKKRVSDDDLFEDPAGKIEVEPAKPDALGQLGTTNGVFRGILHKTVSNWLPKELDAFYTIRIDESCLNPGQHDSSEDAEPTVPSPDEAMGALEYQDLLLAEVLLRENGPALQHMGGFGTCEFQLGTDGEGVDYAKVDCDRPVVAYHPLYIYPQGSLQTLDIGHVGDIHMNARQKLMAKSPARVIPPSPTIASMMNTFEASFLRILDALDSRGTDVLLISGDIIEHVDNAFPYHDCATAEKLRNPSAATIWDLLDVDDGYDRNYQAYVDYLAFFTAIRHVCQRKPVFVVSGNHDAYRKQKLYGIVPSLGWMKLNEGIPEDHNLTFYEARLVFGESWGSLKLGTLFDAKHFQWFYAVLTPFTDFSVELPRHRVVGLGWGEDEEVLNKPGSLGQGTFGHLGRAEEAVTPGQLALVSAGGKHAVVLSHFTFVSYGGQLSGDDRPTAGHIDVGGPGLFRSSAPFGSADIGTFEKRRREMYAAVADSSAVACVLSGHSHRKGVYQLGPSDAEGYSTLGHGMRRPDGVADPAFHLDGRPAMIVCDSCGPLPRLNLNGELGGYGSDRPSGNLVTVTETGQVTRVEPVYSERQAKPRLAVAVDYMQIMGGAVFKEIKVEPFKRADAEDSRLSITVAFHEYFPEVLARDMTVALYAKASPRGDSPLIEISLAPDDFKPKTKSRNFLVQPKDRRHFMTWLLLGAKVTRFMSFRFGSVGGFEDIYDISTTWDIEVEARPSWWNAFRSGYQQYDIVPPSETGAGDWMTRTHDAVPDFNWRRGLATGSSTQNPWNTPF
jgi:predicted phosphodiesterase